ICPVAARLARSRRLRLAFRRWTLVPRCSPCIAAARCAARWMCTGRSRRSVGRCGGRGAKDDKIFGRGRLLAYRGRMSRSLDATIIAARTRAAQQILDTSDLLSLYESVGGLVADLHAIRDAGLAAEAQALAQSSAKSAGEAATLEVLTAFAALQKE